MDPEMSAGFHLDQKDVVVTTARGTGSGGQNRNKTESCVIAVHRPTGIQVRIDNERSQHQNRATALKVLAARIHDVESERMNRLRESERKTQVGSGQRGDKVRTYRTQDDLVTDHRTGMKFRLSRWYDGNW
jgi:peptide chain release factor 1